VGESHLYDAAGRRLRLNKRLSLSAFVSFSIAPLSGLRFFSAFTETGQPDSLRFKLIGVQAFRIVLARGALGLSSSNPNTIFFHDLGLALFDLASSTVFWSKQQSYAPNSALGLRGSGPPFGLGYPLAVSAEVGSLIFSTDYASLLGETISDAYLDFIGTVENTDGAVTGTAQVQLQAVIEIFDVMERSSG